MNSIKRTKPIDSIVVHHTVVPGQEFTKEAAQKALNANKYAYDGKPPYHYIIGKDWDYQGRPYDTIGYHAGSPAWNDVAIGVALMGNFDVNTHTEHQKKRLGEVIKELMMVYNIPRHRVFLHKQVRPNPTACPGAKTTQEFISNLLQTPMPDTCQQDLAIAQQEIIKVNTEIGTVTKERDKFRDMVNSPTDGIDALRKQIEERDRVLDEKRKQIEKLNNDLIACQSSNALSPEQAADLVLLQEIKTVLAKLL